MPKTIEQNGYPTIEEIKARNGWPSEERFYEGRVAVLECVQKIPCNPCESSCPFNAITIGDEITNVPVLDEIKCVGCGQCVIACPGLAIFMVSKEDDMAEVSFPFEYLPLPEKGDIVRAVCRDGRYICGGEVVSVRLTTKSDHTPVVTLRIPREYADDVRSMERLNKPEPAEFRLVATPELMPDDMIVCRCEEITAGEIRRVIRETHATTVSEVKRRARSGMGLCQGRSCSKLVMRLLSEEYGSPAVELRPDTQRPPVRPMTFGELAKGGDHVH